MANSGAFTSIKEWNDVNNGLRLAGASQFVDRIRAAMADLDEATANDYIRVLKIGSSFGVMPGTKGHRDRLRASLLIKLLIGQTNTANASTERTSLLAKSDAELDRMILSEGGRIETDPAAPSSTQLPPSTELVRSVATLVPTPVKKLAIPGAVARHASRHVAIVSNVTSQTNKSVLNVNLNNVFGDEFRLAIQHQLSKYRSSIEGMAVGVDTAYLAFNTGMAKDAANEKQKYDIAISIIKTGLAATGAGPLASIGAAIVGELAKHTYAGLSGMVSSDTLNSGATSGINAGVDAFGGMVEFSQGQQNLWAPAIRVHNVQSVNQSVIAKAASGLKDTLLNRSMRLDGVPGEATLKVTLLQRFDSIVDEMISHLNGSFVRLLTGTNEPTFSAVKTNVSDHATVKIGGHSQPNPLQITDIFLDHVLSTRPDLVSRYNGSMLAFEAYVDIVRKQVLEDWNRLFPPVTPIAPDQVELFAKLCEAKMWCRVIVNEQVRGRKPRDAVIDRLDAVGVVGKWSQSVLGGLRISRGSDDNLRRRIYGEGRLRYHGSKWEVDELRKLAAWIDDDRNVNIPALAAGMTKDGIKGVWDKIWSYNRRVTETRDGPRIAAA